MAMRPKKPRLVDGIPLADNLYPDPRKRPGYWRYLRPDGSSKTFQATTVEDANRLAEEANALRGQDLPVDRRRPAREATAYHVPQYVAYQERLNPGLKKKRSWDNVRYALNQFAESFPHLSTLTHERIRDWWDGLTYHQQKLRMAAFRRFFNWLTSQGLVPRLKFNPFTTADDRPRLLLKEKPKKQRRPLTSEAYRKIHAKAPHLGYEVLQIAMGISRYTTLREGDICALQWEINVVDRQLRVVVSKSMAQKGEARATRLFWDLDEHPELKRLIDRARALSLQNRRCPYVLSHAPKRRVWNEQKEHLYQVTPDRLSRMFAEVAEACEITGTAFHEVRGLSATLLKKAGYTNEQIREIMAHEHISTTQGYQNAKDLPFERVTLRLDAV